MVNLQITYKYGCAVSPSPRSNKTGRIFEADRWDGSSFWLEYVYIYIYTMNLYEYIRIWSIWIYLINQQISNKYLPDTHFQISS